MYIQSDEGPGWAGHAVQVLQNTKTNTASRASATWGATGLSIAITPRAVTSDIYISGWININPGVGNQTPGVRLYRDSTAIAMGDASGALTQDASGGCCLFGSFDSNNATMMNCGFSFVDQPGTTSAITYQVHFRSEGGSYTTYMNKRHNNPNADGNDWRTASNIVVMEIVNP